MKKIIILLLFLVCIVSVSADWSTFQPDATNGTDITLDESAPSSNTGGWSTFQLGLYAGGQEVKQVYNFSWICDSIPVGDTIDTVYFQLYVSAVVGNYGLPYHAYPINTSWQELVTTWNTFNTGGDGGNYNISNDLYEANTTISVSNHFNITLEPSYFDRECKGTNGIFQGNGFIILAEELGANNKISTISSDSATAAQRPKLFVEHNAPAPSIPLISNLYDVTGAGTNKTSDTTPTFNLTTDINADCYESNDNSSWTVCSTTGTTTHQCTISTPFNIGYPQNATVECNASGGSDYGIIRYNITDAIEPSIILSKPDNNAIFVKTINNTFMLNFTATDNYYSTLSCNLTLNGQVNQTDASVTSGVLTNWNSQTYSIGTYQWNVTCVDGNSNINTSLTRTFTVNNLPPIITLSIEDYSQNIDVELGSRLQIVADDSNNANTVCVDIDRADYGVNYSCGQDGIVFNVSIDDFLLDEFSDTTTSKLLTNASTNINFSIDNRTDIDSIQFDLTSIGTTNNVTVNGDGIRGTLTDTYLYDNEFYYLGNTYSAYNLTYSTSGIKTIHFNLSTHPLNLSFQIAGSGSDVGNDLDYYGYFNDSSMSFITNTGLAVNGYYDNMEDNISGGYWTYTKLLSPSACNKTVGSADDYLQLEMVGSYYGVSTVDCTIKNDLDTNFDLKNYTTITINGKTVFLSQTGSTINAVAQLTDGNNTVILYTFFSGGRNNPADTRLFNLTLNKVDTTHWGYSYIDDQATSTSGTVDLSSLDLVEEWKLQFKLNLYVAVSSSVYGSKINIYDIKANGLTLNKSSSSAEFSPTTASFRSSVIANTSVTHNYTGAYIYVNTYLLPNMTFELTADNLTFEDATNFVNTQKYVFTKQGNKLAYRINMTGTNESTPIVYDLNVQVIPTQVENVTLTFGSVQKETFTFTGKLNATNSPQIFNITQSILYNYNGTFVPMTVQTGTAGQVEIKTVIINSTINPVNIDVAQYETCSDCGINLSFTGDNVTVDNLQVNYVGGNQTVNFLAHPTDYSNNVSYNVSYFYSGWNLSFPQYVDYIEFIPRSPTEKNVIPYKQTSTRPIMNITLTNFNSRNMNYSILLNESSSCINDTVSLSNAKANGFQITSNNTWYNITDNKPYLNNFGLWMWADYNCNRSTWSVFAPYMFLRGCCVGCEICDDSVLNVEVI